MQIGRAVIVFRRRNIFGDPWFSLRARSLRPRGSSVWQQMTILAQASVRQAIRSRWKTRPETTTGALLAGQI